MKWKYKFSRSNRSVIQHLCTFYIVFLFKIIDLDQVEMEIFLRAEKTFSNEAFLAIKFMSRITVWRENSCGLEKSKKWCVCLFSYFWICIFWFFDRKNHKNKNDLSAFFVTPRERVSWSHSHTLDWKKNLINYPKSIVVPSKSNKNWASMKKRLYCYC